MRRGMTGTTAATLAVQVGPHRGAAARPPSRRRGPRLPVPDAGARAHRALPGRGRRGAASRGAASYATSSSSSTAACARRRRASLRRHLPTSSISPCRQSPLHALVPDPAFERGDPDGELPAIMEKVVAEANRAGTVVHRLREFVRSGTTRLAPLSPAAILDSVAQSAARTRRAPLGGDPRGLRGGYAGCRRRSRADRARAAQSRRQLHRCAQVEGGRTR